VIADMFSFLENITHFYMRWKAETWQTYRGATQTNGKNPILGKFCRGGSEIGDGKCNVLQHTGTNEQEVTKKV
jgi:hypothetical protein